MSARQPVSSAVKVPVRHTKTALIVNSIVFVACTAAVVVLSWHVADDFAPVAGTMHTYERSSSSGGTMYPHAYPTLDWIMHPAVNASGDINSLPVLAQCMQDESVEGGGTYKNCAPEPWQRSEFCPQSKTLKTTWQATWNNGLDAAQMTQVEKQLLVKAGEENEGLYPCGDDEVCFLTPTIRDSCKIARIGSYHVMSNDKNSWSMASGQNADLLYHGAAIILWLISGFHLINNMYKLQSEDTESEYFMQVKFEKQKAAKRVLGCIAALFYIVMRSFVVSSSYVDNDRIYMHILPNGSYFYVLLSIFWVTVLGSNDPVFCHILQSKKAENAEYSAGEMQTEMAEVRPQDGEVRGVPAQQPQQQLAEFDMSAFSNGKNLNAYLPRLAPGHGKDSKNEFSQTTINTFDPNFIIDSQYFDMEGAPSMLHNSCIKFELAQLFILPLILLADLVRYNAWEIDSKLQLVYVAGLGYALFDVCRNRLSNAATVFDLLHEHKENAVKSIAQQFRSLATDKKQKGQTEYAKEPVRGVVSIIELLSIVLQLLLFFVLWNSWLEHWYNRRAVVVTSPENGRERHTDYSLWFLLIYASGTFIIKLAQIIVKQRDAKTPQLHMFWQSKLLLYTVFCLFVLLTLLNAVFIREPSLFLETRSQINEAMAKTMKDEDLLYSHFGRWSGSWVMVR